MLSTRSKRVTAKRHVKEVPSPAEASCAAMKSWMFRLFSLSLSLLWNAGRSFLPVCKFILCYRKRFEASENKEATAKQRRACGVAPKCPIIPCVFFWFGISVSGQSIERWTQQFCTTATYHITSIRPLLALSVRSHSGFQKELQWLKTNSEGWCVLVRGASQATKVT